MLAVYAGLVIDQDNDIIRLAHYNTEKYSKCSASWLGPSAHLCIAEICLTYLSLSTFTNGPFTADKEFGEGLAATNALNTAKHLREYAIHIEAHMARSFRVFLAHKREVLCAVQVRP